MYISPAEALRIYDVSKPTLYQDMKNGTLSFKFDDRKRRKIDVAELDRLYEKRGSGGKAQESNNVKYPDENTEFNVNHTTRQQIEILQQQIEFLEREIKARSTDAERWQEAFERAQSTADKITALIEDRSFGSRNTGEQDDKIDKLTRLLESRISEADKQDQKITALEQTVKEMRAQNKRLFTELKENNSKGFLKRFFG